MMPVDSIDAMLKIDSWRSLTTLSAWNESKLSYFLDRFPCPAAWLILPALTSPHCASFRAFSRAVLIFSSCEGAAVNDLAAHAAQTLVSSMTTSAWNDAHAKLSAVFNKYKDRKRLQRELDASQARLMADPSLRERETRRWTALLNAIAHGSPDAAVDLATIASELAQFTTPAPGRTVQQTGIALRGTQANVAGNLIMHL